MTIAMNDFERQWRDTSESVLAAVREVGESGWYILGRQVAAFEQALAARLGCAHTIGCASGLDAIELGLRALGLRPGQKVLTTPTSAFATTLAIVRAGGVPVFVDVDDSGLLDLARAEACLAADASIRFVVPVHLYGHALDLGGLDALAQRFDVAIVEDCAQAIGAGWVEARGSEPRGPACEQTAEHAHERPVGTAGRVAALSFYPTKNLGALGDGGALLTRDATVAAELRRLRDYGQSARFVHDVIGLNSRLDELHAAILRRALLPKLDAWTARRRAIAARYLAALADAGGPVRALPQPARSRSVWHLFPVTVAAALRPALQAHLSSHGVPSAVHYPKIIPSQAALRDVPFEVFGSLQNAEALADSELTLPLHPYLSDDEVEQVVAAVRSFVAP